MRNIFKIYKKDLKDIFTNPSLLIVIIALAILPSLYAWFNIKASWDPYGNTQNISVAVVNKDKGNELSEKRVNFGNEVVDKLKDNKNLGWKFVDKEEALEGVNKGTYYAFIEIPEDFSKDLTSIITEDVKKGKIVYTVNEKINAIAPKITDKGASTIQLEVNQTVVKTVSETIFDVFNSIGVEIENQLPKLSNIENSLIEVQGKFKDINKTVNLAGDATSKMSDIIKDIQKDVPSIKNTLVNSKALSTDVKTFLENTKGSLDNVVPIIKDDLNIINNVSSSASNSVKGLIDAINKGSENAPQLVDSLYAKLSSLSSTNKTLIDFLTKLDNITPGHPLKGAIDQLKAINTKINTAISSLDVVKGQIVSGQKPSLDKLNSIIKVANDINNISSSLLNNFDSQIVSPVKSIFSQGLSVANDAINVLQSAEAKLPKVENILNTSLEFSSSAKDNIAFIKEKLPKAKSLVDELVTAMQKINNSEDMDELINLLKHDAVKQAEFLKQPVDVVTEKLYPISNYGAGMTPFYTVLCLWVGVLLLVSLLSTEVHDEYKSLEVYFGRGLTFLSIAIVQALVVSLGDIYLLKVDILNHGLFIALSVFTSIVFVGIVYSLVSLLGNIGKAVAVILLVIQVAASGGTFPIQVTPQFFQNVNPFLPFTYAISAQREAVAGIYMPNLTKDIYILLAFLGIFVLLATLLKKPINKLLTPFKDSFGKSDLTGH